MEIIQLAMNNVLIVLAVGVIAKELIRGFKKIVYSCIKGL